MRSCGAVVVLLLLLTIVNGALTGCATPLGFTDLSPEQISALAKIKDASVTCLTLSNQLYGRGTAVLISADKGIPTGIKLAENCAVEFSTEGKTP